MIFPANDGMSEDGSKSLPALLTILAGGVVCSSVEVTMCRFNKFRGGDIETLRRFCTPEWLLGN